MCSYRRPAEPPTNRPSTTAERADRRNSLWGVRAVSRRYRRATCTQKCTV